MDAAEGMILAGLDQDWALCLEQYTALSPQERGALGQFLIGERPRISRRLHKLFLDLAQTAFLETALRWSRLNTSSDNEQEH